MPLLPWRVHLPAGDGSAGTEVTAVGNAFGTLPAAWAAAWAAAPGARVLLEASGGRRAWCTAGELEERSATAAAQLLALGLRPGDRVVWSAPSSVQAVVANVAALRAGLVVVPANPAYTARELGHIVDDVRPSIAIVDDPDTAQAIAARGSVPVVDLGLAAVAGPRRGPVDASGGPRAPGPDDPALVAYTSGTTGAPKGAVLTHANLLANSAAVVATWRWGPDDVLVHALPIFHGHGLCVALYTTLLVGASAVLLPRFDVDAVLDTRAEHEATMFFGVPTMYHRLAASRRVGELGGLRLAVSGSAPLRAELHGELASAGHTSVLERYGTTETLMLTSNPYDGERRPGTVGFPFPGVEARVEDEAVALDSQGVDGGEILARGPAVFGGYWQRPAATAERFTDGWYRTGDVGVVDDGYLRILGRSAELVISGGYNVYPAEVVDVLLGHPDVVEVAVTGTPSDEWGEVVTAWVVTGGKPDATSLLAFAATRLAPYKQPRLVRFVDALPRNSMGKVVRSELGGAP